ncbi:MAG: DUF1802 family protein [Geitlerinemataceae cyanobacterium]
MSSTISSLLNALCLPTLEIEALLLGKTIVAIPTTFLRSGQQFALCPAEYFRNFSSTLNDNTKNPNLKSSEVIQIRSWARCELCKGENDRNLEKISHLTIWQTEALQQIFSERSHLFLAYLRVYRLPEPIEIPLNAQISDKIGKFVGLPQPLDTTGSTPVLTDRIFAQRRHQLENLEPPLYPELEDLQSLVAQFSHKNPEAKKLDRDLRIFLGWSSNSVTLNRDSNLDWINTIAALGNRSKTLDTGKSNYQAGTDFENIVRDSLEYLGFTVDYAHKGGAGGLDLFCCQPYPLVIECKAGKKIPNDTAVQLLNLGTLRLQDEKLLQKTAKLIIGPGTPTSQLNGAAKVHGMAILKPETLEKLVKLKSQYPGAIDLFQLKSYLTPGQADDSVEKYIDRIESEIKLRSHLIQTVKTYLENTQEKRVSVHSLYGAYAMSQPPQTLSSQEMHEILVELSSPLTGYLGRDKGRDGSDRFYFLRDLS